MFHYTCYDVTLVSEVELPELVQVPASTAPVDITIVNGRVNGPASDADEVLPGLWSLGSTTWCTVPDVARFEAADGGRITVETSPGAAAGDVRIFLLGSVLGAVMWQRGHLVLHGNAFRVGEAAAVVVGHSGAGKSTLAGELANRGFDLLSDDVVPVDAAGRALPGYPRIKLWQDAMAVLGRPTEDYERVTASHAKFNVPVSRGALAPLTTQWVYVLDTHESMSTDLVEVSGSACFDLLSAHTYRRELASDAAASWRHLQQCAALANRARIVRVRRPVSTMTVQATADAILDDIARHPHRGAHRVRALT